MPKVMFICHGNICRSPMAEFVLKDMVAKRGLQDKFQIASSATSREEIGNPVHYGTRNLLSRYGISTAGKYAVQLTRKDYEEYDYLIAMDRFNLSNIRRIIGEDRENKVSLLLDYTERKGDIADPWYTGDFETTYRDVLEGCEGFMAFLRRKEKSNS